MAAPKGNKNAKKLTTPELRQEAYRQYCEWIAKGECKEAWCFEHPELTLTSKTMEKYIKENPIEFPSLHKELAEAKSLAHWTSLGKDMMTSQQRCQPALYQMFMRNKFGWDKESAEEKEEKAKRGVSLLEALVSSIEKTKADTE